MKRIRIKVLRKDEQQIEEDSVLKKRKKDVYAKEQRVKSRDNLVVL